MATADRTKARLEAMSRDELNVHARRLDVPHFRTLKKEELIRVLAVNEGIAKQIRRPTWWRRYHNHVYGWASVFGVLLAVASFLLPDARRPLELSASAEVAPMEPYAGANELRDGFNTDYKRRNDLLGSIRGQATFYC